MGALGQTSPIMMATGWRVHVLLLQSYLWPLTLKFDRATWSFLKDRQHRIAADLPRLSLTYPLTSWVEVCTIYDKIDNLEKYLGI